MAINPSTLFPTRTTAPDADYPQGGAVDESAPAANDGTPLTAAVLNDVWGLLQALLDRAGITPSGSPDTAQASQYLEALTALYSQQVEWTDFRSVAGPEPDASGIPLPFFRLSALGPDRIVASTGDGETHVYSRSLPGGSGVTWRQQGTGATIVGGGAVDVSALTSSRFAVVDGGTATLRAQEWAAGAINTVGNPLPLPGSMVGVTPGVTALSSTRVAVVSQLGAAVFDFDGTDWALQGSVAAVPLASQASLVALSATRFAVIESNTGEIQAYDWNGSTVVPFGTALAPTVGTTNPRLAALSSTDVVVSAAALGGPGEVQVVRLRSDGTWLILTAPQTIPLSTVTASMATLGGSRIVVSDYDAEQVWVYDVGFSLGSRPHSVGGGAF